MGVDELYVIIVLGTKAFWVGTSVWFRNKFDTIK